MDKPKIGIGHRVGMLEVIEETAQRKNGYIVWKCKCDCGNEITLDTRALQRETVQDCGCFSKIPVGGLDLTGKRFGRLVAIEPTNKRKYGGIIWRCVCDCDKITYVSAKQLVSGATKSCGCWKHPPLKDYVGKRFGQLTVIAYEGKKDGMHRWRCKCDCGNETVVGQTLLQSGKTKSCGCLQSKIIKDNLKLVDHTSITLLEASKKRKLSSNTSGYTGVYQNKKTGKWIAQITFKRKTYYLGSFEKMEDAVVARKEGESIHEDFLSWYYDTYENGKHTGVESHV